MFGHAQVRVLPADAWVLDGMVSKRRDRSYKAERPSKDWIKVKNRKSPAMLRAEEGSW